jgi:hypothetical protein
LQSAIARLGSIWSVDSDAIIACLTKVGTYAALLVSSALRQYVYPINSQETENTVTLVQAAVTEAAALSLVFDRGVLKSAASYTGAVIPAALFHIFTTPHLVNGAFSPYLAACDIVIAIASARGGPPEEILTLGVDTAGLYTDNGIPIRVSSKDPILTLFLYGAFLAETGTSSATSHHVQPARLLADAQNTGARDFDQDGENDASRDLMISNPQNILGYLLAPINDALSIALSSIETFVASGMDFLTDFQVPTINVRLPPPPSAPTVPNIEPYVHQLTTVLTESVTDAGNAILARCNSVLADYRKFLNSGLIQDVSVELSKAVTSGLEIYFGILNEAVAIWSKTITTILKSLVVKIEPKIRTPVIASAAPVSLQPIVVRTQRSVSTAAATRAPAQIGAVVSDISEGVHVIGFVMLMIAFLSVLFRVL